MAFTEDQVSILMDLLKIPIEKQNFEGFCDQIHTLIEENDSFKRHYLSKIDNTLEKILNNPGLQHIAEKIFDNLKYENLKVCQGINQSSKQILDYQIEKPMFLLRKFRDLSKENQKDWIKDIASVKNSEKEKAIIAYMQWNLKKKVLDLPCYSRPAIQEEFRKKIWDICCEKEEVSDEDIDIVKILAPLTENPDAPDEDGWTPIQGATSSGCTEIVKILLPLTDNLDYLDRNTDTFAAPIATAVSNGYTEIVKLLAPFSTKSLNALHIEGYTLTGLAAKYGQTEVVKLLASLVNNPNLPDEYGVTPIFWAAENGHTEIVKILAPLTDNPNAANKSGDTPLSIAAFKGHIEIVKLLEPLTEVDLQKKIRAINKEFNISIQSLKRKDKSLTKTAKKRAKKF